MKVQAIFQEIKNFGALGPLAVFVVAAPGVGAILLTATSDLWFDLFKNLPHQQSIPTYLILTVLLAGLSFIPTHASSLIGGLLFGLVFGPIFSLLGVAGAAFFSFVFMKKIIGEKAVIAISQKPKAQKIYKELLLKSPTQTCFFIFLIRLSPIMPFAGTNLILSAAKVNALSFIIGSCLGLAPRVILVALMGAELNELDLSKAGDQRLAIIGILSTIFVIYFIGKIAKKALGQPNLAS